MALIAKAAFITQMDAVAAALTAAYSDTVKTEFAKEVADPRHPLRKFKRCLTLNPATGVFTTKTAYIDAVYDNGAYPTGTTEIEKVGDIAPVLSTATVENAAPTQIVLTFDAPVTKIDGVSIGGAGSVGKTITGIAIAGNVVTITVSAAYISTDVITVSGTFFNDLYSIILVNQSVTNNVT